MSSTLNQDLKGETSLQTSRMQNESLLFDASSLLQNTNTFGMEHLQNHDGQLNIQQDTPTTPSQLLSSKNNLLLQSNYLQSMYLIPSKEYYQASMFSPMMDNQSAQLNQIFSPDLGHRNPRDDGLILQTSHHQLNNPNFQFADYENIDMHGTPYAPNGNISGQNIHYSQYPRMSSFQNSQRNTPMNPISVSPHISMLQSGGRLHAHNGSVSTPHHIQNFIHNSHNNLFSQGILHQQSPYINMSNNKDMMTANYDFYNNFQTNDVFDDDMSLKDWIPPQKDQDIKEEDERSQSFVNNAQNNQIHSKLKKKQKIEEKEYSQRINDENADMNSCTQDEINHQQQQQQQYNYGKSNTSQQIYKAYQEGLNSRLQNDKKYNRIQNSSEKTLKQQYYLSSENDKCSTNSVTPVKVENSFNYMTPNGFSKSKIKEEEFSSHIDDQTHLPLNYSHSHQIRQPNGQDPNADSDDEKGGKRNQRGLRILSMKVKDIVCELKETTYKQVAEFLIKDLESKKQNNNPIDKEEQNVKRRVYDALNVLIAANVLTKSGKKVKADHTLPKGKNSSQNPHQMKEYLQTALKLKRDRLERKQETINDLVSKFTALKNLCDRNAQNEKRQEEINALKADLCPKDNKTSQKSNQQKEITSSQSLKCISLQKGTSATENEINEKKLRFPFIGIYSPSNNSKISFKKFSCGLAVSSIQQLNLKGDIDILVTLYKTQPASVIRSDKLKFLNPELIKFLNKMQHFLSAQTEEEKQEEQQQLQMEITIRNNKHVEQHHYAGNGKTQKIVKNQQKYNGSQYNNQQQENSAQDEEEEDSSVETINQQNRKRINGNTTNPIYQTPQPSEYHQNHNNHNNNNDYEDSNQLVNDYIN